MRYLVARKYLACCVVGLMALPAAAQDVAWGKRCPPAAAPCETAAPLTPAPTPEAIAPAPAAAEPSLSPEAFAATGGGETFAAASSAVGYIDPAIPMSMFRLRVDAAYNDNRPDRADFFYARYGGSGGGPGPANLAFGGIGATSVKYQEVRPYLEYAPTPRFSAFIEAPYRFVDLSFIGTVPNDNHNGFSDLEFGFKYALLLKPEQVLTFQWRTFSPTGDPAAGLGRNNWNLEPGLLYYQRLADRLNLEAELLDFIPIAADPTAAAPLTNAGNVLQYGVGLSYVLYQQTSLRVAPVAEFVGWTVLSGQESVNPLSALIKNAAGDTIVNGKFGVRTFVGKNNHADIYAGYGRALTGDVWYKEIMRFEFRWRF